MKDYLGSYLVEEVVLAGHSFSSSVIIWSDSQGDGPALSPFKLMMKGQSCLANSGQQLEPLSGNHTVLLTTSSLTFQESELSGDFF